MGGEEEKKKKKRRREEEKKKKKRRTRRRTRRRKKPCTLEKKKQKKTPIHPCALLPPSVFELFLADEKSAETGASLARVETEQNRSKVRGAHALPLVRFSDAKTTWRVD